MICALVAAFSSCSKEYLDEPNSGGEDITANFTVQLPESATRAAFDDPTLTKLRLFVMISKDGVVLDYQTVDNWDFATDGVTSVSFRLGKDITYDVSAWADFGDTYYSVTCINGSAPKVAVAGTDQNATSYELSPSNLNDAYFAIDTVTFTTNNDSYTLTLQRPFGLVKVNTTDLATQSISNLIPDEYKRLAVEIPTSLDLLTGEVGDKKIVSTTAATNNPELSFEYIFASETSTLYDFTYQYYSSDSFVSNYTFSNIPVLRNNITSITGDILTYGGNIQIEINADWSSLEYVIYVNEDTTEADLIAEVTNALTYTLATKLSLVGTMKASELNFTNSALNNNSSATINELNLENLQTTDDAGSITNKFNGDLLNNCMSVTTLDAPNIVGFTNEAGDAAFSEAGYYALNTTAIESLTIGLPYTENISENEQSKYAAGACSIEVLLTTLKYLSLPSATTLGSYTINYSSVLEVIDIPKVTLIGNEVFNDIHNLNTIILTSPDIVDPYLMITGEHWKPTNSENTTIYLHKNMDATTSEPNVYGFNFKEVIYVDDNGDPI